MARKQQAQSEIFQNKLAQPHVNEASILSGKGRLRNFRALQIIIQEIGLSNKSCLMLSPLQKASKYFTYFDTY